MKKAYAFIGILFAAIATSYLAAEDRERGERERNPVDFEKVAQELKKAVAEGKISEEDARRRLGALRERVGREQNRKPTAARGERDRDEGREELLQWGRKQRMKIEELKKAGKHEEAEKLAHETRRIITEKMRHLEGERERGERNAPRERQHTERGEREHNEDPLERWVQQRARQIEELAEEGRHEEARELERETKRIVEEKMRHRLQEHEELRRWAHAREREVKELAEEGRHEEARRLAEDTSRTIEEKTRHLQDREHNDHEHGERDHEEDEGEERFERWVHQQKRHIHELHENNQHEEAEQAERELAEKMEHFHREREREHGDRERHEGNRHRDERVHQLMVAIEHLRAAGMHDLAEEVERRAHGNHNQRDHHGDDHGDDRGNGNHDLNQLRGEVDELKRALHEMREFIGRQHEDRNRNRR